MKKILGLDLGTDSTLLRKKDRSVIERSNKAIHNTIISK